MYFHFIVIISPWKRAGPFIWTNLNPLYPRMLCAKFGWNWPSGSGEEYENVKSLQTDGRTDGQTDRQTDRQKTDDRWSEKLTWAFRIRWAKNRIYVSNLCTIFFHWIRLSVLNLFSSSKLKAQVSFSDRRSSVCLSVRLTVRSYVRLSVICSYFQLLLKNHWANFNQTWNKAC